MAKVTEARKNECLAKLRELLPPGSTVYSVLRHVSSSGMSRRIDFYKIDENQLLYLTAYIADALGYSLSHKRGGGMNVGGCGMDVGFDVVHSLSYALHGMNTVGDDAIDAAEAGVPFEATKGQFRAGDSLRHEWI